MPNTIYFSLGMEIVVLSGRPIRGPRSDPQAGASMYRTLLTPDPEVGGSDVSTWVR